MLQSSQLGTTNDLPVRHDGHVFFPADPSRRDISSPVTEETLGAPDPELGLVQVSSALSDAEYAALGDWLGRHPQIAFRVYGGYDGRPFTDLEFLRFFPKLRSFYVDSLELTHLDGLRQLPADTFALGVGQTRKRLSLAPLSRFTRLQRLFLEGHTKDIDVISNLGDLTSLTLRSITLPDLTILTPLQKLRALDLKLGGTTNLQLLNQIGRLQYLELWMVRALDDISIVGQIETLEHLFLQALKQVTTLPSFSLCTKLSHIHLETMKGITDLTPLLTAPALTDLALIDMRHLQPADVTVLKSHPSLQRLTAGLGSKRKNNELTRLMPLPAAHWNSRHPALEPSMF